MPKLIATLGAAVALLLAVPTAAIAAGPGLGRTPSQIVEPIVFVNNWTVPPDGFPTDANQAVAAAKATHTMQALHQRLHPLQIYPYVWLGGSGGGYWYITFVYQGKLVAEVDVTRTGKVERAWTGPQAYAPYSHGNYAPLFDSLWVIVPFALMFLLPFIDPKRLRRVVHVDALVVLSFLVSYGLFNNAHLQTSVWLVYPPLLYLLVRMIWIGMGGRTGAGRLSPLLSNRMLMVGLLALVVARIVLSLVSPLVLDVGYASVVGASHILHAQPLYYANAAHADTYGPIVYLAYVPFELIFPWHGKWDYLPSAHAASLVFDLVTIGGLVLLGRQLRRGRQGLRLGLVMAWAWAACPFTLLALIMHTNDGLIAMLSVLSLLAFSSPAARGALLGLAAAAKFSPAALLPLYAGSPRKGWKGFIACVASFTAVVVVAIAMYLPSGGLSEFYNHTIGFQLTRADVFSPWALHPGLDPIKTVLEAGALLFAAAVAFVPRQRSLPQLCALAAAVTIAVQLPAVHWFYYYIVWFIPFVAVAVFAGPERPSGDAPESDALSGQIEPEPVLVAA